MTIRGLDSVPETEVGRNNRERMRKRSFALYRELAQIEPLDYEDGESHRQHFSHMKMLYEKHRSRRLGIRRILRFLLMGRITASVGAKIVALTQTTILRRAPIGC